MKLITVHAFQAALTNEKDNDTVAFINVCTPTEYEASSIDGVENMPLSDLESRVHELEGKTTVYVHCASGARAQLAIEKLQELGVEAEFINMQGGLMAWVNAGLQTAAGAGVRRSSCFFKRLFS